MMAERSKLFEDDEPDLSQFAPRTDDAAPLPRLEEVRGVSNAGGFPSRDSRPVIPERHYYRTGRDTQFNTKVRPDVKAGYMAIATEDNIPIGKVLEDALEALLEKRRARG
jgi:hypothetical protein